MSPRKLIRVPARTDGAPARAEVGAGLEGAATTAAVIDASEFAAVRDGATAPVRGRAERVAACTGRVDEAGVAARTAAVIDARDFVAARGGAAVPVRGRATGVAACTDEAAAASRPCISTLVSLHDTSTIGVSGGTARRADAGTGAARCTAATSEASDGRGAWPPLGAAAATFSASRVRKLAMT